MRADPLYIETQPAPTAYAAFSSILGERERGLTDVAPVEPAAYHDLNLDQVVSWIVEGRDEYDLRPFFYAPLRDIEEVAYRHEVFGDLAHRSLRDALSKFSEQMHRVRSFLGLTEKQHYRLEQQRWFLEAAGLYAATVRELSETLDNAAIKSRGLRSLRSWLEKYTASPAFTKLVDDHTAVRGGLDQVRYTLLIRGNRITVDAFHDEPDYSVEVEATFERFRQSGAESHLIRVPDSGSMDHVEAQIAERVARLYPKEFAALTAFCADHIGFVDSVLARFDREVQFYLAYLDFTDRCSKAGGSFSFPRFAAGKDCAVEGGFDVALAAKIAGEGGQVVCNDFTLSEERRLIVVTGPNQGGKTTFARMFGQLFSLAALGVPVPARRARVFLPDQVFTHFEHQEDISTLRGKLEDELVRVRDILDVATDSSVIVVNEIFASTTLDDAVALGTKVLTEVIERGCAALFVTFVDELATLNEAVTSMVAEVDPNDPTRRTFKVLARPADGRAYALALAGKYGLTYDQLVERVH